MRRHILHRWSVILLLGARLILGDFVQAMPHEHRSMSANGVAAATEQAPCHDAKAGEQAAKEVSSGAKHDGDCCESSGGCQCVCAHVSAVAAPSLLAMFDVGESGNVVSDVKPTQHRLSGQFRPPA